MGYDLVHRIRTWNIGPLFHRDDVRNPLTINQEHYREIIIAPFVRDLKCFCCARNLPLWWQWMQQDGATAHTEGESLACLQQHFGDQWSLNFLWNSHSPHPPWISRPQMLKESVFRSDDPPGNVPKLWEKIQSFFVSLQQPVVISMSTNLKNRYEQCVRREGTHFEHIQYKCI